MRRPALALLLAAAACGGDDATSALDAGADAAVIPPTADVTRDVVATGLTIDLAAMSGTAVIELGASAGPGASLEVGDLDIRAVRADGVDVPFARTGAQLDLGVGAAPVAITIDYGWRYHDDSDGAAAALVLSAAKAKELGVKPLGYFRSFVTVGVDPAIMGIGPLPAVQKLLAKNNLTVADIDLFEMNEAFACQAVYCQRELGIPDEKLNVNGGAIALGHPLGCTGAKLTATALYELRRRGGRYAIVTMCIGGGQGAAGLFERA